MAVDSAQKSRAMNPALSLRLVVPCRSDQALLLNFGPHDR
jgi:hypothetical protein